MMSRADQNWPNDETIEITSEPRVISHSGLTSAREYVSRVIESG